MHRYIIVVSECCCTTGRCFKSLPVFSNCTKLHSCEVFQMYIYIQVTAIYSLKVILKENRDNNLTTRPVNELWLKVFGADKILG